MDKKYSFLYFLIIFINCMQLSSNTESKSGNKFHNKLKRTFSHVKTSLMPPQYDKEFRCTFKPNDAKTEAEVGVILGHKDFIPCQNPKITCKIEDKVMQSCYDLAGETVMRLNNKEFVACVKKKRPKIQTDSGLMVEYDYTRDCVFYVFKTKPKKTFQIGAHTKFSFRGCSPKRFEDDEYNCKLAVAKNNCSAYVKAPDTIVFCEFQDQKKSQN